VISGGAGNDMLAGGAGTDLLFGGAGNDTADYSLATAGVTVDLGNGLRQAIGADQGTDLLNGIENLIGSAFADTLSGDRNDNVLTGGGGDDTLTGGTGRDTLAGGTGSDIYRYVATTDGSTTPGDGDSIANTDFVSGTDVFNFLASIFGDGGLSGAVSITAVAFNTDQSTTLANLTTAAGTDQEAFFVELTGSTFNSTLYDAIDTALQNGTAATGRGFIIVDNGTDTRILFDNDFATASSESLVEIATITGLADGGTIVSNQDLQIVAS
jgi:Ca2+-binding RTX toxin-like protein